MSEDDRPDSQRVGIAGRLRRRRWLLAGVGVGLVVGLVGLVVVVQTFVLGAGCQDCDRSRAAFDFEYDAGNGTVRVVHAGGDRFDEENTRSLTVRVDSTGDSGGSVSETEYDLPVRAGEDVVVEDVPPGATVRVVWTAPDGGNAQTMASFEVPDE